MTEATWTERMTEAMKARWKSLDPKQWPHNLPPDLGAWRREVDRVDAARSYLLARRFRTALELLRR